MGIDWRQGLPVLRSAGVTLREPRLADAQALFAQLTTPEVTRFISTPPDTPKGFERFVTWAIRQRETGQSVCYGVVPEQASQPVGIFQVHQLEPPFRTAEWGFVFGRPYWGLGIMPKGARLLLGFVFDTLGVKRLEARAMAANGRANGVLRKLGATEEGRLSRSFLMGRQHDDDVLWAMLNTDWVRLRDRELPSHRL